MKKMNLVLLNLIVILTLLSGCCCSTVPENSSGFCPYGTYGSACTNLCNQMSPGDSECFSNCMNLVKSEYGADATTCCTSTYREQCREMCYDEDFKYLPMDECITDCVGMYQDFGLDIDSCALPV
ncbi:hypothetical protein KO465_00365 [Candidatus Micrarchaeota archaeon]|jgi:hypothetical protein|nr:hypothetical protein [Candidatus Micrarchaeota archaeon]